MSLNKTLDRLFNAIRLEAKRNPEFADRLDAILRAHASQRDVDEEAAAEALTDAPPTDGAETPPAEKPKVKIQAATKPAEKPAAPAPALAARAPDINPVGVLQKGGEDALEEALISQGRDALLALIAEHNLDPSGEASKFDRDALQAHVVAQAKRRVERDKKLFEY